MRRIREVLRQRWECGLSERVVAASCSLARSTVGKYVHRAQEAGLGWPLPDGMTDEELERFGDCEKTHHTLRRGHAEWGAPLLSLTLTNRDSELPPLLPGRSYRPMRTGSAELTSNIRARRLPHFTRRISCRIIHQSFFCTILSLKPLCPRRGLIFWLIEFSKAGYQHRTGEFVLSEARKEWGKRIF